MNTISQQKNKILFAALTTLAIFPATINGIESDKIIFSKIIESYSCVNMQLFSNYLKKIEEKRHIITIETITHITGTYSTGKHETKDCQKISLYDSKQKLLYEFEFSSERLNPKCVEMEKKIIAHCIDHNVELPFFEFSDGKHPIFHLFPETEQQYIDEERMMKYMSLSKYNFFLKSKEQENIFQVLAKYHFVNYEQFHEKLKLPENILYEYLQKDSDSGKSPLDLSIRSLNKNYTLFLLKYDECAFEKSFGSMYKMDTSKLIDFIQFLVDNGHKDFARSYFQNSLLRAVLKHDATLLEYLIQTLELKDINQKYKVKNRRSGKISFYGPLEFLIYNPIYKHTNLIDLEKTFNILIQYGAEINDDIFKNPLEKWDEIANENDAGVGYHNRLYFNHYIQILKCFFKNNIPVKRGDIPLIPFLCIKTKYKSQFIKAQIAISTLIVAVTIWHMIPHKQIALTTEQLIKIIAATITIECAALWIIDPKMRNITH